MEQKKEKWTNPYTVKREKPAPVAKVDNRLRNFRDLAHAKGRVVPYMTEGGRRAFTRKVRAERGEQ